MPIHIQAHIRQAVEQTMFIICFIISVTLVVILYINYLCVINIFINSFAKLMGFHIPHNLS